MVALRAIVFVLAVAPGVAIFAAEPEKSIRLGVEGTAFTVNDKPTFLIGMSYYGALGAPEKFIEQDLDDLKRLGFNWIRVWATWGAFENDVSAVDGDGRGREGQLKKLKWLLGQCDARGMIVDVTLSRGNGVTGPPRLQTLESHRRAVETIVAELKNHRNWYLDLSNERNIGDKRHTSFADLKALRDAAKRQGGELLITASHAGDISEDDLRQYLLTVEVDFISPHRPRQAGSPEKTESKTREYIAAMTKLGRVAPVHYQEPFRRGFGSRQPSAEDFLIDFRGARSGGAAGWCFHNGDERARTDGKPRRSFDLRASRLFEQLDDEERKAIERMRQTKM
ncbi:MAG: hypothetical protein HYS13_10845 [Planctomycetia bacterium]|nr:hypothetical protein [Planctomycetia bacterium]